MKVVIVGGGFAGVKSALNLANNLDFEVTLISKETYFEYHSALYRSATGRSIKEVALSLPEFFGRNTNITVVHDEIIHIDTRNKSVAGLGRTVYTYDVLLLCVGAVTNYFGITGLPEFSYGVNTLKEALELRSLLHKDLVSERGSERNYVVVGGGATGIELSTELIGYLRHIRKRHNVRTKFTVDLIEASAALLPTLPAVFTHKIQRKVRRLGVKVLFNTAVKSETIDTIQLPKGNIRSHIVMWTAGATNNPLFAKHPRIFTLGRGGKVVVDEYLQAFESIYVLGDGALTQYSGMAQTAVSDATFMTANLKRLIQNQSPRVYKPKKPIYAIPAGPYWAAVLWGRFRVYGFAGWVLRRLADLRLFLLFLPLSKALSTWRAGFVLDETCPICKK